VHKLFYYQQDIVQFRSTQGEFYKQIETGLQLWVFHTYLECNHFSTFVYGFDTEAALVTQTKGCLESVVSYIKIMHNNSPFCS